MQNAHVPERIVMVFSDSINVEGLNVVPAFPVDANNKKRLETAESWADRGNYRNRGKDKTIKKKEYANGPFVDVKIVELEERGNGGRAYKVVVGDDYYVDFREAEMMWVIKNVGIRPGGIMNGEFAFAVVGSQTKLIPMHSPMWEEANKLSARKAAKPLGKNDFKVGHQYVQKNGSAFVIVAEVVAQIHKLAPGPNRWSQNVGRIDKRSGPVKRLLLCETDRWSKDGKGSTDPDDLPAKTVQKSSTYQFKLVISPSAIEDLGPIPSSEMCSIADVAKEARKAINGKNCVDSSTIDLASMMPVDVVPYMSDPVFDVGNKVWG